MGVGIQSRSEVKGFERLTSENLWVYLLTPGVSGSPAVSC